jgi:hypothetical protein
MRWLFPEQRRRLPHGRAWNIAARTVHIGATGILLGGHVFGVAPGDLWPFLWMAIATGVALVAIEVYPSGHWLHQGCAIAVYVKLGLLGLVPFFWNYRVPILMVVVVIASVGSHAPRTIRHYSVVFRRVMVD